MLKKLSVFLLLFLSINSQANSSFEVADIKELSIGHEWFGPGGRSKYLNPGKELNNAVYLDLNMTFMNDIMYMKNRIFTLTDKSQFRFVSWSYELGIDVADRLDIYYRHFSGHLLDETYSTGNYPFENAFGIKLYLIKK